MIELTDCVRAISEALEAKFGAPPLTKDITEEFPRPALFLYPASAQSVWEGLLRHDTYDFTVVRFTANLYSGYVELLNAVSALTDTLSVPITATTADGGQSYRMVPEELTYEFFRADMAVEVRFRVELYQESDVPATPAEPSMDNLVLDEEYEEV